MTDQVWRELDGEASWAHLEPGWKTLHYLLKKPLGMEGLGSAHRHLRGR